MQLPPKAGLFKKRTAPRFCLLTAKGGGALKTNDESDVHLLQRKKQKQSLALFSFLFTFLFFFHRIVLTRFLGFS
jgi:hypothetical protein